VTDLIEVSYTGDLLAHRRCARAWAYEKHVGIHPYEQVQAMEGFMVHHAMQWLTDRHRKTGRHARPQELTNQLNNYFLVLWAQVEASVGWTLEQVRELRETVLQVQRDPLSIEGGDLTTRHEPLENRIDDDLKAQCTACSQRFDCTAYHAYLAKSGEYGDGSSHPDVRLLNVEKN